MLVLSKKKKDHNKLEILYCLVFFGFKLFLRLSCLSIYQSCRHNLKNSDLRPLGDRDHRAFHADHRCLLYQRVWCRSVCPSGATFGLLGKVSLIRIQADITKCDKCGACTPECHVPEALKVVFAKDAQPTVFITSTDCTMCGKCMDVCDRQVFSYSHRLKKLV